METLARNGLRKTFMLTDNLARQNFRAMLFSNITKIYCSLICYNGTTAKNGLISSHKNGKALSQFYYKNYFL